MSNRENLIVSPLLTPQLMLSIGITVAAVAVGWGILTAKQQATEVQISEIKQNTASKEKIETLFILIQEMKADIKEIKDTIKETRANRHIRQ